MQEWNEDDGGRLYDRLFQDYLVDSSVLLDIAEEEETEDTESSNTLARASILNSMIVPEIAANICIDSLDFERSLFADIDKMSVIAKFDIFIRMISQSKRRINRGGREIQSWQDIKTLRDRSVHPKAYYRDQIPDPNAKDQYKPLPAKKLPILGITSDRLEWGCHEAVIIMRAVHGLMRYIFTDCCRWKPQKTTNLLWSVREIPKTTDYTYPYFNRGSHTAMQKRKVDLSYIKLNFH